MAIIDWFDDLEELSFYLTMTFVALGCVGGFIVLTTLLMHVWPLFGWTLEWSKFVLVLSIGMWLSTFLMTATHKLVAMRVLGAVMRIDTDLINQQTYALRENSGIRYAIASARSVAVNSFYYSIFVILPIVAALAGYLYEHTTLDLGWFALLRYYSIIAALLFTIISFFSLRAEGFQLFASVFGLVIGATCVCILWFLPSLHPYRVVTYLLTSAEVSIVGIKQT
jgi:hypothetical protein